MRASIITAGDTPTCVGKSQVFARLGMGQEGHPHVCGEELVASFLLLVPAGTPPRVWGRDLQSYTPKPSLRDTPTCVGKRLLLPSLCVLSWGHPHVCGEETLIIKKLL